MLTMDISYTTVFYLLLGLIVFPALLWRPHLLVYLLIIVTFFPYWGKLKYSLGNINIHANDLIFICYCLSLAFFVFTAFLQKRRILDLSPSNRIIAYFVLGYIILHVFYMVSALLHGVPVDSIIRRFEAYSGCLYFFLPLLFIRDYKQHYHMLVFIVAISLIFPVWQLYGLMSPSIQHCITSSGTVRAFGFTAAPLLASTLFAILIWQKGMNQYLLSFFPIVSIFMIGHRSGYVALALSVVLLFYWLRNLGKLVVFSYLAMVCIPLILICFSYVSGYDWLGALSTRASDTFSATDDNTLARVYAIRDNALAFLDKPLLGIGYNHELIPISVLRPHNFLMRHLSNTGIVGTSLISIIIGLVLMRCRSCISRDGGFRKVCVFLFCSMVFFLVYALMNTVFFSVGGSFFWILAGISVFYNEKELETRCSIPGLHNEQC